jgi:hypothetical protein
MNDPQLNEDAYAYGIIEPCSVNGWKPCGGDDWAFEQVFAQTSETTERKRRLWRYRLALAEAQLQLSGSA